jgi:hypothetical protein
MRATKESPTLSLPKGRRAHHEGTNNGLILSLSKDEAQVMQQLSWALMLAPRIASASAGMTRYQGWQAVALSCTAEKLGMRSATTVLKV